MYSQDLSAISAYLMSYFISQ